MKKMWQMWKAVLSDDEVSAIIKECEYYNPEDAKIGADAKVSKSKSDVRRSTVRWVDVNDTNSKFIYDLIWRYAEQANRDAFGFDINYLRDVQYTVYEAKEEGFYNWHVDTFWGADTCSDRKLSVTIQLSDAKDYKGGDFKIEEQYEAPDAKDLKQKGTIFIFPSFIYHMVEPVTQGTRKSLVAWIEGPESVSYTHLTLPTSDLV